MPAIIEHTHCTLPISISGCAYTLPRPLADQFSSGSTGVGSCSARSTCPKRTKYHADSVNTASPSSQSITPSRRTTRSPNSRRSQAITPPRRSPRHLAAAGPALPTRHRPSRQQQPSTWARDNASRGSGRRSRTSVDRRSERGGTIAASAAVRLRDAGGHLRPAVTGARLSPSPFRTSRAGRRTASLHRAVPAGSNDASWRGPSHKNESYLEERHRTRSTRFRVAMTCVACRAR